MRYFPQKCDYIYEAKQKNAKGKLAAAKAVPAKRRGRGAFKALRPFPVVYLISKTFLKKTMHMQRRSLRLSLVYQSEGGEVFVYTLDRILAY